MQKHKRYKIATVVLFIVVLIETTFILTHYHALFPKSIKQLRGRIAIVIDDWGYNLDGLDILEKINYPLTMAVLPEARYSGEVAEYIRHKGFEIILHLPLEPYEKFRLEKHTIMTGMNEATIREIISASLDILPGVKGVSEHMGSRATEDRKTMGIIFKELKKRRLYFLDSLVSRKSVCRDLAHNMRLRYAQRNIFLDNEKNYSYILGQIGKLKLRARVYGYAIGIGHAHELTLAALKDAMPQIEKEGYRFVFVSELVR